MITKYQQLLSLYQQRKDKAETAYKKQLSHCIAHENTITSIQHQISDLQTDRFDLIVCWQGDISLQSDIHEATVQANNIHAIEGAILQQKARERDIVDALDAANSVLNEYRQALQKQSQKCDLLAEKIGELKSEKRRDLNRRQDNAVEETFR